MVSNAQAQARRREVLQVSSKQALNIPAGAGVEEWSEHSPVLRKQEKMQEEAETTSEEKRARLFGR